MTGSINLGRIMGIPFRLHWSWFLAVFLIAWTLASSFFPQSLPQFRDEPAWYWGLGVAAALGLFLSVLLHELGHAFVARRLGIPMRGITLFIFGGVAEMSAEPRKPSHEILVALGGPLVTLVLIVLYGAGLAATFALAGVDWNAADNVLVFLGGQAGAGTAAVLWYLALVNGILLLFNLLPAFPLDGGRVFRGVVWAASGDYLTATRVAGAVGIGFAWLMFLGGFYLALRGDLMGGLWLFFLGMFLNNAAQSSMAYAQLRQLLGGVRVADLMRTQPIAIPADEPLREVVDHYFLRHPYKAYPVVRDGSVLGVLSLRGLQEVARERWDSLRAGDVVTPGGLVLHPDEPALGAMRRMAESGQSRLPVVKNGTLVGMLCARDIIEFVEVRAGLGRVADVRAAAELPDDADEPAAPPRTPSGRVGVWIPHDEPRAR